MYQYRDSSLVSVLDVNQTCGSGVVHRVSWVEPSQKWDISKSWPKALCDTNKMCGVYSTCEIDASPSCNCLKGFKPRSRGCVIWSGDLFDIRQFNDTAQNLHIRKAALLKGKDDRKPQYLKKIEGSLSPQKGGGLGIQEAGAPNKAHLSKLVWRLHQKPDELWGRVLKAKYFHDYDIMQAPKKADSSWTWRSVQSSIVTINTHAMWQVRTGNMVRFWTDHWILPDGRRKPTPRPARVPSFRFASAEEGEATTVLNGIRWAQDRGHQQVIIKTDAEAIYTFCRTGGANISWTMKAILQDCLALFVSFVNIRINFAPSSL
ncbi:hypothetical protein GIB67_013340 [Kingdonia uniflora]|uniref:RNase H type-1 domain-containing protein n=1 Tax=Kingdonia uniflora TaxID=39325 RepID=A0A7J7LQZ0_9MAGN|nr:hypothetical protein GIB67_013340 [Kingdonia uniflora]